MSEHDCEPKPASRRSLETCTANDSGTRHHHKPIEPYVRVPVEVICRKVHGKLWMNRTEAQSMLQVTLLAHELDVLAVHVTEELRHVHQTHPDNPLSQACQEHIYLRPVAYLLPILCEESMQRLRQLNSAVAHVMHQLEAVMKILGQSSEQNWSLVETLQEVVANGGADALVDSKRKLAELEDELVQRIEQLLGIAEDSDSSDKDIEAGASEQSRRSVTRAERIDTINREENDDEDFFGKNLETMDSFCEQLGVSAHARRQIEESAVQEVIGTAGQKSRSSVGEKSKASRSSWDSLNDAPMPTDRKRKAVDQSPTEASQHKRKWSPPVLAPEGRSPETEFSNAASSIPHQKDPEQREARDFGMDSSDSDNEDIPDPSPSQSTFIETDEAALALAVLATRGE